MPVADVAQAPPRARTADCRMLQLLTAHHLQVATLCTPNLPGVSHNFQMLCRPSKGLLWPLEGFYVRFLAKPGSNA